MRVLFPAAPGYGLMLPIVPLVWAARAAGHEVLFATTAYVTGTAVECGLPTVDVFPQRDVGADLILASGGKAPDPDDPAAAAGLPPGYWRLARQLKPFELFALAMTEGTVAAGRHFGADLVVYPADHVAGMLTATALGVPALEVGNRVSWSLRDEDFRADGGHNDRTGVIPDQAPVMRELRERLGVGDRGPDLVARIDPRAPSLGGLERDEPDSRDGVPWWAMRYVPYNGGGLLPEWARKRPERPRICLTLGTVTPLLSDGSRLSLLMRALGELDVEVILADHSTDLSRLGALPDNVIRAGYLPLSTFLDSCALVVHHGGSGTTAAALHYGVPQLLLPEGADNPLVARRVVDRKAGLALSPADLDVPTAQGLVRRLLTEPAFRRAAAQVSAEMAAQPSPAAVIDRFVREALDRRG
ncbi:nucleotide disphospho-sugar-binding domain-containing protein [Micromonospora sp. NPDC002296]|uniref:nucleotide disphospho-sugar-binding domain-containing protein n=1 Tax=Micromonospora sp. NPDC002296 TaxID=3154271 RepID=UPI00331EC4D0